MKKLISLLVVFAAVLTYAANDKLYLHGRVKESTFKTDLIRAKVKLLDKDGQVADSNVANRGRRWSGYEIDTISEFYIQVPRIDSVLTIQFECDGYQTETINYPIENIGKREEYRQMPTVYLQRSPQVLNEVKVTSSKIKFYNKGDTLVYNAAAVKLAEGSMRDEMI